jgi:hypothetical protein
MTTTPTIYSPKDPFARDTRNDRAVGGAYSEILRATLPTTVAVETRKRVHGVALGGTLPPGTYALVAPWELRSMLSAANPPGVHVLRPGDAYVAEYPQGIAALVVSPYAWATPTWFTTAGYAPLAYAPTAEVHCFYDAAQVCRVNFSRVPGYAKIDPTGVPATAPTTAPVETLDVGALEIPSDAATALIHVTKINGVDIPIRLDEDYELEVYWLTESRHWAHSEADDFDAAGTGLANAAHDAEQFDVAGLRAVYVRRVSGGATGFMAWHAVFGW